MPDKLQLVAAKMPPETVEKLDQIRERLQAERPGSIVSRSEALRYAVETSAASTTLGVVDVNEGQDDDV
jgi:hypothetical protein